MDIWPDPKTRLRRMKLMAPAIQYSCAQTGENRERLMALCYRESWCTFAPGYTPAGSILGWGDHDNAFGPFQIDRRYHSDFIKRELGRYSWAVRFRLPYSASGQAIYACGILREARDWFKRSASALSGDALERATYAAYNAGPAAVAHAIRTGDPSLSLVQRIDAATTGKNYSADIFARSSILQKPQFQWIWNEDPVAPVGD